MIKHVKLKSHFSLLLILILFAACQQRVNNTSSKTEVDLYAGFQNPPTEARPFVRWWWPKNAVNKAGILNELNVMQKAGIGGVEINPLGENTLYDEDFAQWLSPKSNEMIAFAASEANKRGMFADLIATPGWPFNSPNLEPEERAFAIMIAKKKVSGPSAITSSVRDFMENIVFPTTPERSRQPQRFLKAEGETEIRSLRLIPKGDQPPFPNAIELSDKINGESFQLEIPEGDYTLYMVFTKIGWKPPTATFMPGSHRLNQYNKTGVEKILNQLSDSIAPFTNNKLGNVLRAVFNDSFEYGAEQWIQGFEEEFKKRRGYDLVPYLPAVLDFPEEIVKTTSVESTRRVLHDVVLTSQELMEENFFIPYNNWNHEQGTKSRVQAYGRPWTGIDGMMLVDIPETEAWMWRSFNPNSSEHKIKDHVEKEHNWLFAPFNNKWASSAAHLSGKNVVSCETFTAPAIPFRATLDRYKTGADMLFMAGVNNMILHGKTYSTADETFPGQVMMGTVVSQFNTWWPYFKNWADYTARLSWLSQQCQPNSQVAILGPAIDPVHKWNDDSFWYPWHQTETESDFPLYLLDLWQPLQNAGYTSEYVTEKVIRNAQVKEGKLAYGKMNFDALLVLETEALDPETAQVLLEYAEKGVKIIFAGSVPNRANGLLNAKENDAKVQQAIQKLLDNYNGQVGSETLPQEDAEINWVLDVLPKYNVQPRVKISNPDKKLFQNYLQLGDKDIFVFANQDWDEAQNFIAEFSTEGKTPWIWDTETGERKAFAWGTSKNKLQIELKKQESLILVFEPEMQGKGETSVEKTFIEFAELNDNWTVDFEPAYGDAFQKSNLKLVEFSSSNDKQLREFGGLATYKNTFKLDSKKQMKLDLGTVYNISEVKVNGKFVGKRWFGVHEYDISEFLQAGENKLEIKVVTPASNLCIALSDEMPKVKKQNIYPGAPLEKAGLVGPVKLLELKN